ncbi:CBS domain-containing protein [Arenicella xantha]|uniref:CBS domain protein n=1 Tax=Arenicella xantha TaxID=644221 RepID=A0A395JG13_9GAMM|nr:CBS domain-containing protein [Arenicella xantha]RBP48618.1 CBS domain protein [Arenicella xantha]
MLRSVQMKDYMLANPVKVKPSDDVFEAIHQLLVYRVSGVCVVDDTDKLVGVLSELDCLRAILSSVYNKNPVGKVSEYMTKEVISVKLQDNIVDVATDMMLHKHRRRPVISDDGTLIGQVTCRQLLRAVKDFAAPDNP